MKGIKIIALLAASVSLLPVAAQENRPLVFGGMLTTRDLLWAPDMAQLSQTHVFGTSRVMGMGGAFTSLGADLTSMSLNPAGLGMYRRNEVSLTPMVSVNSTDTPGTGSWMGNNRTRFSLANVGAALNVYESSSRALTSMTLGFGMNRIADFNQRYSFGTTDLYNPARPNELMPSIADIFKQQLNDFGLNPYADGKPNGSINIDNFNPRLWPAILGYEGYMVGNYGTADRPDWDVERIGRNASIDRGVDVLGSGSINEFDISLGANFNNIVYVGATLGIQSVYQKIGITYSENYLYEGGLAKNDMDQTLPEQLTGMNLYQASTLSGSGVNFKLGVIVRPVAGLRLGAAFHTPTYYSLARKYYVSLDSEIRDNQSGDFATGGGYATAYNERENSWDLASPTRLMFGASYTFGSFAIVSVDYQRDWYNGIRVKNTPEGSYVPESYKAEFKQNFQATNTLRAGLEVRPLPILALRLGGGYTDSMLKDRNVYVNSGAYNDPTSGSMPTTYESYYISAGVGVSLSRTATLDFSYQNLTEKRTDYQLFDSFPEGGGEFLTYSGVYNTSLTRHFIAMTLSFRF